MLSPRRQVTLALGNDSTILGTPQFGFETAARDPRQIQLALKFSF